MTNTFDPPTLNNIMIIDDADIDSFMLQYALHKKTNFCKNSVILPGGLSALNYLKKHMGNEDKLPELIFLDILMPVVDGYKFLEEFEAIRSKLNKKVNVVILTSEKYNIQIGSLIKEGKILTHFQKPFHENYLKEIASLLGNNKN